VLDPVMISTSGTRLLDADAVAALLDELLPLASVFTPNLPEAAALLDHGPITRDEMGAVAAKLRARGAAAVLLKGGHLNDDFVVDVLDCGDGFFEYFNPRLPLQAHGTGCALSSAIAARLALGDTLPNACRAACEFVHRALCNGYRPGKGDVLIPAPTSTAAQGL
jgi:hydroxymethylpyrimidine/phosphomethylpyrimidine kinase